VSTGSSGVLVVDDEPSVRSALARLLRSVGLEVQTFSSSAELLNAGRLHDADCLILDVRLPGVSGLELQETLGKTITDIPIIFISGHGDVPMSVRAMKAGAVEFLLKPFKDQELLDAIQRAVRRRHETRVRMNERFELQTRYESLTKREREVLAHVVEGRLNKQIAFELGTSERTIKIHRSQVMRKMSADSLPDLVRMADKLAVASPKI
jgi:FixJ family two-component response regulator